MDESFDDMDAALRRLSIPGEEDAARRKIENGINKLLLYNFEALIQLLYKIDVSEQRLKNELAQNSGTDAAVLITDLIIQRQKEKRAVKQSFGQRKDSDISPDDAW